MEADSGIPLDQLRTDGGMVANDLLMQFQADILDRNVIRPAMRETTALGAAYAAGLATGFYKDTADLTENWEIDHTWKPRHGTFHPATASTCNGKKRSRDLSTGSTSNRKTGTVS